MNLIGILGDGYCDDNANNKKCFYDKGDCCLYDDPDTYSLCSECFCYVNITEKFEDIDCFKVLESIFFMTGPDSIVGNGVCDLDLNNVDKFFDAGDCCLDESNLNCKKSNVICNSNKIGDGKCQDYNNGPNCNYDLGDC